MNAFFAIAGGCGASHRRASREANATVFVQRGSLCGYFLPNSRMLMLKAVHGGKSHVASPAAMRQAPFIHQIFLDYWYPHSTNPFDC